jgi:hypothetical protein
MQPDISETVALIRRAHRKRMFAMDQRKRADLALGSFLRLMHGWQKDGDEETNKAAREIALAMIEAGEKEAKGKPFNAPEGYEEWQQVILASIAARAPFDGIEAAQTRQMEKLAETLPVWEWVQDVRGFSARFLATIVAEAGDLSAYPKKGHLWKRMGLAVFDGRRQGGLPKNASADDWIAHGYNRKRRSQMYVIGDVLVKVGDHYKQVFRDRCAYEHAKAIADGFEVVSSTESTIETWSKRGLVVRKVTKAKFNAATMVGAGHLHRRSQRYMEKMLLRDLLREWKAAQMGQDSCADKACRRIPTERPMNEQSEALRGPPSESKATSCLPSSAHLIAAE